MSMTESEALEKHKEDCRRCKDKACERNHQCLQKKDIEVYEEIQQYRAIGTVSEFRELKEKATAKKLKHGVCPNCSTNNDMIIKNLGNPQGHKTIFCWNCGSCIDWSEGKE